MSRCCRSFKHRRASLPRALGHNYVIGGSPRSGGSRRSSWSVPTVRRTASRRRHDSVAAAPAESSTQGAVKRRALVSGPTVTYASGASQDHGDRRGRPPSVLTNVERVFADTNVLSRFRSWISCSEWPRTASTSSSGRTNFSTSGNGSSLKTPTGRPSRRPRSWRDPRVIRGRRFRPPYAAEVDDMPSHDVDDRKHIAAAKAGRATVPLTRNLKHFPAEPLLEMSIRVLDTDADLCEQLPASPSAMR